MHSEYAKLHSKLITLAGQYGPGLLSLISKSLDVDGTKSALVLKYAFLIFLRYANFALKKQFPSTDLSSSLEDLQRLQICAIVTLSRYFVECPPLTEGTMIPQEHRETFQSIPETWQVLIWQSAQLESIGIHELPTSQQHQIERLVLDQLAGTPAISCSYDAMRKSRERMRSKYSISIDNVTSLLKKRSLTLDQINLLRLGESYSSTDLAARLTQLIKGCGTSEFITPLRFIGEVEEHGAYRQRTDRHEILFAELKALSADGLRECYERTKKRLLHKLAKLAESVRSTYASLMMPTTTQTGNPIHLKVTVSHNVERSEEDGDLVLSSNNGIVGRAYRLQRCQIVENVAEDSDYVMWMPDTCAEMAIPLIDPGSGQTLGVLNLEATEVRWFTRVHLLIAASKSRELIPDLLVLAELEKHDDLIFGWHYRLPQWSIDDPVSTFCEKLKQALRNVYAIKVAVTVWESDPVKNVLWVRGTSGYDYEYGLGEGLPVDSFLGRASKGRDPIVCSLEEALQAGFLRETKARQLGVKWVAAVPIKSDSSSVTPWGVLAIYGYRSHERIDKYLLTELALKFARSRHVWDDIRPAVAFAYTRMKLARVSDRGKPHTEAYRDVLKEIFGAQGVSIFLERNRILHCQASTGLQDESGKTVANLDSAIYDLGDESCSGVSAFLAKNPGVVVRKNDATNDEEPITGFSLPDAYVTFSNKFRETTSSGGMERRRFLGLGMNLSHDGLQPLLAPTVVRIVRRASSRPFRPVDENLMRSTLEAAAPLLELEPVGRVESAFSRVDIAGPALIQEHMSAQKDCAEIVLCILNNDGLRFLHSEIKGRYHKADSHLFVKDTSTSRLLELISSAKNGIFERTVDGRHESAIVIHVPIFGKVCDLIIFAKSNALAVTETSIFTLKLIDLAMRMNLLLAINAQLTEEPQLTQRFAEHRALLSILIKPDNSEINTRWDQVETMDGLLQIKNISLGPLFLGNAVPGIEMWSILLSIRNSLSRFKISLGSLGNADREIWNPREVFYKIE